jgi:hypothetical protein
MPVSIGMTLLSTYTIDYKASYAGGRPWVKSREEIQGKLINGLTQFKVNSTKKPAEKAFTGYIRKLQV